MTDRKQSKEDFERSLARLEERAIMRSSHEIEDSVVINQRASLRVPKAKKSLPPPFSYLHAFIESVPPQHRVWPLLLAMILGAVGFAKVKGWF